MNKFVLFLENNYVKICIIAMIWVWLFGTFNYTTVYKADGKYIYEAQIGSFYERAEYGDGYVGKYIINDKEVYTITIK